jgi:RimJ/RimL family protein N-acetyltransferase
MMTIDDPRALWRVQLALECKAFDDAYRLVPVPCADPDPLPTGYAVRYSDGSTELAYAATAPPWIIDQIGRCGTDDLIDQPQALVKQLWTLGHSVDIGHFHTYRFDDNTAVQPRAITHDRPEAYSIVIDGHAVAGASSSRSNDSAAELWIETQAAHRRHGYATILAQVWAANVQQSAKIAFYSHLHDNVASAALARKLGVSPLFEVIAVNLM